MQHCALQHSSWHGICIGLMRLLGMNLAGVRGDGGASSVAFEQHKRNYQHPGHH